MNQHFLQSPAWEQLQQTEGHQTFSLSGENYSALAILQSTPIGKYLFCPYGPTLATADITTLKLALNALTQIARKQQAFFIRIEPPYNSPSESDLKALGLKKSHDIDPAHTWVLDLTQPEEKIFADMEKEKGRLWRNCHKKGISMRQTQDPAEIDILMAMLSKVGSQNHFIPQDKEHLLNQMKAGFATLYIAELDGAPIAASLVYDHDGVRYYAHAAADYEHRKLAAGSILLVQMIIDAKANGTKVFDFWGITTSEDKNHPWYGFSQYKRSFGGAQVDYAGTWDLPLQPVKYHLYQVIRRFNRLSRKVLH